MGHVGATSYSPHIVQVKVHAFNNVAKIWNVQIFIVFIFAYSGKYTKICTI